MGQLVYEHSSNQSCVVDFDTSDLVAIDQHFPDGIDFRNVLT